MGWLIVLAKNSIKNLNSIDKDDRELQKQRKNL
jgi:hypothetical protein